MAEEQGAGGADAGAAAGAGADKGAQGDAGKGAAADAGKGADGGKQATLLDDKGAAGADAGGAGKAADGDKGVDWRNVMTGGDAKRLGAIQKYTSATAVVDALLESRKAISEGKMKPTLAADATPEQIAAYRKDNGIPEKSEEYLKDVKLADGTTLVIGENDKALYGKFAEEMHKINATPAQVHTALSAYQAIVAQQADQIFEQNEQARLNGTEALMSEWGNEFRGNKNAIKNMLAKMPDGVGGMLESARDQNGLLLLNNPTVLKALAQVARDLDPNATVVEASGGDVGKSISDELSQIQTVLRTKPEEYWARTPQGEKMRLRMGELLAAQARMGGKAA